MVAASRSLVVALSLVSLALALFDTEETNTKKIRCAQGSQHSHNSIEIEQEKTLGCRLTLIYDEYFIIRMIYYDYHRMNVESNIMMDCDEDGFISVICTEPMCNLKIADGLRKGAKDTVARNYYLQCLYHKSIQRTQPFIGTVMRGVIWWALENISAIVALLLVRNYKRAKRQNTIDMVQAYERKKVFREKMMKQFEERERKQRGGAAYDAAPATAAACRTGAGIAAVEGGLRAVKDHSHSRLLHRICIRSMDELHDLTVAELRARLKQHSLPTAGKKSELIKRLSVLPQSAPSVDYDNEPTTGNGEEDEEAPPVIKKKNKKKTSSTKKSKSHVIDENETGDSEKKEEEEIGEEMDLEVPVIKKKGKKKTSTSKKSKKSKSIDPIEENEAAEEAEKKEEEEDEMNTSNQTYDVVSPKSEEAKDEEEKAVKSGKKATPIRRASECRRSIFKRLGLDPAIYTPTSGKKRPSTAATPTTAKKRKSMVEKRKDTVEETIDEESTVATDTVEEEMEEQDEPIAPIAEEEEETVEDEEQEEKEEEESEYRQEKIHDVEATMDDQSILSMVSVNSAKRRRSSMKEQGGIQANDIPASSEFWSDDEEVPVEVDQSMLSEVSSKPSSSRRTSLNKRLSAIVNKTQLPPMASGGSATRTQLPLKALSGAKEGPTGTNQAPRSAGRMAPGERFGRAHAKLFEKQEFIGDTVAKKEQRKAALLKTNTSTQRLATPKSTAEMRQPLRDQQAGFKFGSSAIPKSFQFGSTSVEEIQKVQKRPSAIPAPTSLIIKKKAGSVQKLDAKARAKVMVKKPEVRNPLLLPTIPDDCSFVERMATPRAILSSASRTHRGAGGYTPKRGKVESFVDTTKLSDRQYQLAMEAGLLPGGSKKNQKTSSMMKEKEKRENEERRNRARDDLLNVKRQLKLN